MGAVRPRPRRRAEGFVDGVAVPDGILERAAAIVRFLPRAALHVILDALDAVAVAGRLLRNEGATKTLVLDQIAGNVAELGGEILVDEQDVHVVPRAASKRLVALFLTYTR